ncbi:mycofactocin system GMC family oxidoreductase MftG [Gordonia aurantiaca]|uniref:mycofactocin system GMC family oxidoreductase MftG n=1 Tax=Gordonia sp. B21 TaxID=3151852 RepID=UPI003267B9B3
MTPALAGRVTADVVIVGAGSAGCVLAERLSRDPDRQVVLLERGPERWPGRAERDLRRLPIGDDAPYALRHRTNLHGLTAARGNAVGGSSAVNGGYFLRWHREDFASWPQGWDLARIEAAYDELDGPTGTMSVSPVTDDELGDAGEAFEGHWSTRTAVRPLDERWPVVGVNRVLSNRTGPLRRTAAEAYLASALGRPNLRVMTDCTVVGLETAGSSTVTGVRAERVSVSAGEVVLCAGTLGTAHLLLRSGLDLVEGCGHLAASEHRGLAVYYRRRSPASGGMVLPTVLHTQDGFEIRCYRDDFASYITNLPAIGAMVEVTAMQPSPVRLVDGGDRVDLIFDEPAPETAAAMRAHADAVVEMLNSPDFADIVVPGSVTVADVPGFSQHAWGTMPLGECTDRLGGVPGVHGLRIVDGSILPAGGRSGPHATIMMTAVCIGDELAGVR